MIVDTSLFEQCIPLKFREKYQLLELDSQKSPKYYSFELKDIPNIIFNSLRNKLDNPKNFGYTVVNNF